MKTLVKLTVLITTFLMLLFTTTSCLFDGMTGIKGSRNVVSEHRNISSDFEKIKVQQGINLYLTQGKSTEIKIEADDNIIDLLKTEVENNQLKIYFEKNVNRAKAKNVYLTTDQISEIRSSSGASVLTENVLQTNTLILDSSSGSSMKIQVHGSDITSESSSGSQIKIMGKATTLQASSSSGSSIKADKLECIDVTAKASSGSEIDVNVSGKLTAKASSGGDIDYEGNPKNIDKKTSSGGSVSSN